MGTFLSVAATSQILVGSIRRYSWECSGRPLGSLKGEVVLLGLVITLIHCDLRQGPASSSVPWFPQLFGEKVDLHDH